MPPRPPALEPPVDEPPVDEPPVDEPPVDEPPVDEPPVDEPPVDEPPVDEPPLAEPPVDVPPLPPVAEPEVPPVALPPRELPDSPASPAASSSSRGDEKSVSFGPPHATPNTTTTEKPSARERKSSTLSQPIMFSRSPGARNRPHPAFSQRGSPEATVDPARPEVDGVEAGTTSPQRPAAIAFVSRVSMTTRVSARIAPTAGTMPTNAIKPRRLTPPRCELATTWPIMNGKNAVTIRPTLYGKPEPAP
jgi:hypothetical protein